MKERLDEQTIALRAAKELQDGWYVNLGFGIPTQVSNFIPEGKTVYFQAENGLLGFGAIATPEEANEMGWRYVNGGAQPVLPAPGMSVFDFGEAFDMIRGGHLDLVILGGVQVSEKGDLANWSLPTYTGRGGTIGGAMDLAGCTKRVFVTMSHTEKDNKPKIVKKCTYALTAKECVSLITDVHSANNGGWESDWYCKTEHLTRTEAKIPVLETSILGNGRCMVRGIFCLNSGY